MRKVLISLFIVSFAGFCFAPINLHDKPSNAVRPDAATEQDLQRQQGHQKVVGEIGSVPQIENGNAPVSGSKPSDSDAQGILGRAQNNMDTETETKAKQTLAAAQQDLDQKKSSSPGSSLFMGGIFLCLGFGVVFGLRQWVNKTVPVPEVLDAKKVNW